MKKAKGIKITSKAVTKGLAIGFLSYGLLIGFIYCIFIAILYSYYQAASITQAKPLLFSFFVATLIGIGIVILNYGDIFPKHDGNCSFILKLFTFDDYNN